MILKRGGHAIYTAGIMVRPDRRMRPLPHLPCVHRTAPPRPGALGPVRQSGWRPAVVRDIQELSRTAPAGPLRIVNRSRDPQKFVGLQRVAHNQHMQIAVSPAYDRRSASIDIVGRGSGPSS
jgi:hypothetical protein